VLPARARGDDPDRPSPELVAVLRGALCLLEDRANSEEIAQLAEELESAALKLATVPLATAKELAVAQARVVEGLKCGLAESDSLNRIWAEASESIRVHISLSDYSHGSNPFRQFVCSGVDTACAAGQV
jgi:hypothetical protein